MQTKDRTSSLDFPTPPPAISDANDYSEQAPDEYLSLKVQRSLLHFTPTSTFPLLVRSINFCQQELDGVGRQEETGDRHQTWEQQKMRDREKERDKEEELMKEREQEKEEKVSQGLNVREEKAKRQRDGKISRE